MAKLNDDGTLDFSENDWQAPAQPKKRIITDPSVEAGDPGGSGGAGSGGFDPGNPAPSVILPPSTPAATSAPDPDADARAFIAKLAAMPGADPSLAADPDYWVRAYSSRGGLNDSNKQYWQDAAVGPTAFFNNPNRESGGAAAPAGGGSATSAGSGSQLSDYLLQLLMGNQGNKTDPARAALMARINGLMDQYSQPVTAEDPTISASTQAYTGQVGRGVNAFKKTAAERSYAEGVPTGSFDAAIGNAEMSGGRSVGDFQTGLMRDETLSRRNSLMSTLQSAGGLLSAQDQADIQNKIANMDAVLKSAGIDVSNKGLDITSQLGNKGLDIQKLLGTLTAGNSSTAITNQNNQFYDKLGTDTDYSQQMLNYLYHALGIN